ncbi:glycoside hydrolase family 15 protein [Piedraia hortae CBS 480.64]|uniref:Glycoside hydrolase family 15 protein n=1 Tax=Piedraia hortae CBS 480.64 TaxID=1314780 RepID=A0A6A7BW45_9PEZI|nr:glycoside hydrolase family 15 protein [Piedraia hortae CBS 480.64]
MPIENYGIIGNMRTAALIGTDGGLDFLCWPNFDSPSIFARLLDKDIGGHFTITLASGKSTVKQQYMPSSNILQTTFWNDAGVMGITDYMPRPTVRRGMIPTEPLRQWLVRGVECIRGCVDVCVECLPAFNYARDRHRLVFGEDGSAVFESEGLSLELTAVVSDEGLVAKFEKTEKDASVSKVRLTAGQKVSFVLRERSSTAERISVALLDHCLEMTRKFWFHWIRQCNYQGQWQEAIHRSLFILKLLTFEPTGATVAAPTFSLPEEIGGTRNWDYRYSWVRDSSFVIYIFLKMGFNEEAEAYMRFIEQCAFKNKAPGGGLPIMFTIFGEVEIPEIELSHLAGYRNSAPVRIGNGAAFHTQLDVYGELMDAIYLYNKHAQPVSWDRWVGVRNMIDHVCTIWKQKDMSIWEVRGEIQNFTYSKVLLWVAIDRALRLADKRSFSCPQRDRWLRTRDAIMEEVMEKGYNKELQSFIQSYEHPDVLDSAMLIAPLTFFIAPNDPRMLSTINRIMKPLENGGLWSAGLVHRYDTAATHDGVSGDEGAFSMCTFWLVEALTRAGRYDASYLEPAVNTFERMLGFGNHLSMFSEEISNSGEQLGNTPQAFSHLALISAAFNLNRVGRK